MSQVIEKFSRMPRKRKGITPPAKSARGALCRAKVPDAKKREILGDAKNLIMQGWTIDQIAAKYGIAPRTIEYWFSDLGDEYKELRDSWLEAMLFEAKELISSAPDTTLLAKGREMFKAATWYAERRNRARYAQELNVNVNAVGDLGDRLRRARERVIEHEGNAQGNALPAGVREAQS